MSLKTWWKGENKTGFSTYSELDKPVKNTDKPLFIISDSSNLFYADNGSVIYSDSQPDGAYELLSASEPIHPSNLGDPSFCREYNLQYPYVGGSMAYGISSPELATALSDSGMIGFIGTGGLGVARTERIIKALNATEPKVNYGCNLIYVPSMSQQEMELVNLYIREGVKVIEASAYVDITPAIVKYRAKGLSLTPDGKLLSSSKIIAKASRVEVAEKFLSPAPEKILRSLVSAGEITEEEAKLASKVAVADDITAEADSGGHTDGRPAMPLFASFTAVRDRMCGISGKKIRVGFGGGIGTPSAAAAAFAMGAAYIVVGSIHQACIEGGTSEMAKQMLLAAKQADTAMAPSADMFDIGGKVQVLKSGTLFAMRAQRLLSIYNAYTSIEELSEKDKEFVEKTVLRDTIENVWKSTCDFFKTRSQAQIDKAMESPKYKMALIFRYYLGQASRWAINSQADRKMDFQIWAGPAIGAFNEWTKDTFLADTAQRKAAVVAKNIMKGAAVISRMSSMRHYGLDLFPYINITPEKY